MLSAYGPKATPGIHRPTEERWDRWDPLSATITIILSFGVVHYVTKRIYTIVDVMTVIAIICSQCVYSLILSL